MESNHILAVLLVSFVAILWILTSTIVSLNKKEKVASSHSSSRPSPFDSQRITSKPHRWLCSSYRRPSTMTNSSVVEKRCVPSRYGFYRSRRECLASCRSEVSTLPYFHHYKRGLVHHHNLKAMRDIQLYGRVLADPITPVEPTNTNQVTVNVSAGDSSTATSTVTETTTTTTS